MTELIGRFHPVLVHLPVGILLLAVLFHLLMYKKSFKTLQPAIKISLLIGSIAAITSCISGWFLSLNGEYEEAAISKHQWFGIGVAIMSFVLYFLSKKNSIHLKWLMPFMALLITITGHLGGSITHGEGYLTKSFSSKDGGIIANKPIHNIQQAIAFNDIVKPILEARCYACHGPAKQKGKLRLDEPSLIDKGGEEGNIIVAGSAGESEIIKRMLLPLDNKDHMPPKEKPQPTKAQIELLNWWINSGADYHKKVTELKQPEKIKPYLTVLQIGGEQKEIATPTDIPQKPIDKAPDDIIQKLKALDVAVNTVSQSSNYLQVNFVAVNTVTTQQLQLLKTLSKQIIWLKIGNVTINDSVLATIANLTNITRLFLNSTNITDKNIGYLKKLTQLQYLNLSGTAVTATGLNSLKGLTNLKNIFLYQTNISPEGLRAVQKTFSKAVIDIGGYSLKFLPTDTIEVKKSSKK